MANEDAVDVIFREAEQADVPAVIDLLLDDELGSTRETDDMTVYYAAFERMRVEGGNSIIVGELDGEVIATYQLTLISGLSLRATRRAQLESVRVSSKLRSRGIGEAMIADAERRARDTGCTLMQLTMNQTRTKAHRFYERVGFANSHFGFKRDLE